MGSAVVVVLPDHEPEDAAAVARVVESALAREPGATVTVVGWPPDLGQIAGLLDPT